MAQINELKRNEKPEKFPWQFILMVGSLGIGTILILLKAMGVF